MNYDITFCDARSCPKKGTCKRAYNDRIKRYETYLSIITAPFTLVKGVFKCDLYSKVNIKNY